MMKRLFSTVAVLAAMMSFASVAAAQGPICSKDALLSLVDKALDSQPSLPRLAARHYGTKAAFLKIRYGRLNEDEASALLNGLLDAGVHGMDELALAWSIHMLGNHEALAKLGEDRTGLLSSLGISAIRALLLTPKGPEILLDRIAATPTDRLGTVPVSIMTAVIDQPDVLKETIALAAEKRDISSISPLIAAHLFATMREPKAWDDFVARRSTKGDVDDLTRVVSWEPALVGNPVLKRTDVTPDPAGARAKVHSTMTASAYEPELDFLNTYLNQTGDFTSAAAAAQVLKTKIDAGAVRRNGTFDAAWLIVYRELIKATGDRKMVEGLLGSITIQTGRYASNGRFTIGDVIDRLLIVEALTPFVSGKADALPEPPVELSEKMRTDWGNWTSMASLVKGGNLPDGLGDIADLFGIVAELLYAKGDIEGLAGLIGKAPAGEASVFTATDFAVRLDRQCASYLAHPAEAVLLSGQPIFKFDTQ